MLCRCLLFQDVCIWFLLDLIDSLRMSRWSVVALPLVPPACASDMFALDRALLFTILSYIFPMLLATVIPLSLEHFPLVPFPL